MAMSHEEVLAKKIVQNYLRSKGYKTYAEIFDKYHFNRTRDPSVLGYMEPKTGTIVVNGDLSMEQVSVVVRHEILHFYLDHTRRIVEKLLGEKNAGLAPDDPKRLSMEDILEEVFSIMSNYAMDYEISNRGYTDEDKEIIRSMHALVTEDDHPGWENLTMEEMYDKLREEEQNKPKIIYGGYIDGNTFIGQDGTVYGID